MTRRRRLVDRPTVPRTAPVAVAHPAAVRVALFLADGDRRRLRVLADGAVLVVNHPRHGRPAQEVPR